MIEIGDKVKEIVTGYEGIVLAHAIWAYNGDTFGIQKSTLTASGMAEDAQWFDEVRLDVRVKGVLKDRIVPTEEHDIKMLDVVRDSISGIEGKVTSITSWITGCVRIGVARSGTDRNNKLFEAEFIPVKQIVKLVSTEKQKPVEHETRKEAGPMNHPKFC
jgi:hypothetical protein